MHLLLPPLRGQVLFLLRLLRDSHRKSPEGLPRKDRWVGRRILPSLETQIPPSSFVSFWVAQPSRCELLKQLVR